MLLNTDTSFYVINELHTIINEITNCNFKDFINHDNKIYALNHTKNTLTILEYTSSHVKLLLDIDIKQDVNHLSNIIIAKDMHQDVIIGFIHNEKKTFEIYKLNHNNLPLLHTHRSILISKIEASSTIERILFQDGFFYLVSNIDSKQTKIYILKPDLSYFGNFIIPFQCFNSIMGGKYIFYHDTKNIYKYDILKKKNIHIISYENIIETFTISINQLYVINNHILYIYNFDPTHTCNYIINETITKVSDSSQLNKLPKSIVNKMIHNIWGNDYQHTVSNITKSYVETFFPCHMNRNQKYINDLLAELTINIYSNEKNIDILKNIKNSKILPTNFRDIHKVIIFGSDIQDILEPPRYMFNKYYYYQYILNDMESLLNIKDISQLKQIITFVKERGIDINHTYTMSGQFHYIKPNHAKGWHNNFESVPKGTAEVIYFVATDVHEYGGSFFLYRHPYSKMIHAVPDISGTYKKFYLLGDEINPLWHAIGSFTANRLSLGFSKRADMELYEQNNKDIFK